MKNTGNTAEYALNITLNKFVFNNKCAHKFLY